MISQKTYIILAGSSWNSPLSFRESAIEMVNERLILQVCDSSRLHELKAEVFMK